MYQVTKTYGHDVPIFAVYRVWRSDLQESRLLRSHALKFTLRFTFADDFNYEKEVKFFKIKDYDPIMRYLDSEFCDKFCMAHDDPLFEDIKALDKLALKLVNFKEVGCHAFAKIIHEEITAWVEDNIAELHLFEVTVSEDNTNSFTYGKS